MRSLPKRADVYRRLVHSNKIVIVGLSIHYELVYAWCGVS